MDRLGLVPQILWSPLSSLPGQIEASFSASMCPSFVTVNVTRNENRNEISPNVEMSALRAAVSGECPRQTAAILPTVASCCAHEKRREVESRQPTEKLFRLLKQRLLVLKRWRDRGNRIPGLDQIRRFAQLERGKGYQQAVERVAEILTQLAPEQDLVQPWRAALRDLEATRVIEQLEESAPWPAIRRKGL
jgi:hypothetical protein